MQGVAVDAGHADVGGHRVTEEDIMDDTPTELRARPDLRDPATRGCVLELVREAWSEPRAHAWTFADGYPTEAEALVAAWEAASC